MRKFATLSLSVVFLALVAQPPILARQTVPDFTDADFRKTIRQQSRVLFYALSPGMPLSIEGLKEIREAGRDLKAEVVVLADPRSKKVQLQSLAQAQSLPIKYQKSRVLRDNGIQLHYPTILVADRNKLVGSPIAGFKSRTGYVTLISDLLKLQWKETFDVSNIVDLPKGMNHFFKPLYGTELIISGWSSPNFLLNLQTKDVFRIPATGDPGGSPDAEFVTMLDSRGLSWYSVSEILAGRGTALLHDPGIQTYQSMGILPGSSVHRVIGAQSSSTRPTGLKFRDYEASRREGGGSTVTPVTEWRSFCEEKRISIPMISKTGLLLSGSYAGTMRVFRIGPEATECAEIFDWKVVAGKADFSADDRYLLYVSRSEGLDTVFLADLSNGSSQPIYRAPDQEELFFPGFPFKMIAAVRCAFQ